MADEVSGVLLVDKPVGPTSFDVVRQVKRLFGVKSAGHTGTLDPNASGLLVLCLGDATRIATFLGDGEKEYEGVVRFGETTDTLDAQGIVLERRDATGIEAAQVESALAQMTGVQQQAAPMYSARKVDGRRLYELAREGKEVERTPKEVVIDELRLASWTPPDATIFVRCSRGTYVRVIAAELGEKLGTGAHLAALRRLSSGNLHVRDAVTPQSLEEDLQEGGPDALVARLHSVEVALSELAEVKLDARLAASVAFGNALDEAAHRTLGLPPHPRGRKRRLTGPDGLVIAVGESDGAGTIRLLRVLRPRTGPGNYRKKEP
jgi:tRNA pseudouridine55 synthase